MRPGHRENELARAIRKHHLPEFRVNTSGNVDRERPAALARMKYLGANPTEAK